MKKIGIILLILQAISLFETLIQGDNPFAYGFVNLIGRFSFAIIGTVLIVVANRCQSHDDEET